MADRINDLMYSLRQQESTDNYQKPDEAGSGCWGGYQFCQDTWDSYANKAGLSDYVGIRPDQAPPEVQDAVTRAELEENLQRYNGDERYAVLAHYGGQGAADKAYANQSIPDTPETYNGKEYPSQNQYVSDILDGANGRPIDWNMPEQDGMEDTGLANTNSSLASAVRAFGSYVHSTDGVDMQISGGWRSAENNAAVNGAENSNHLSGNAVDIVIPDDTPEDVRQNIINTAIAWGFNSDGEDMYHDKGTGYHLHLTLPTGQLSPQGANWTGVATAGYSPETVQFPYNDAVSEIDYQDMYNKRPFGDKLSDTFYNMWYDNGVIGAARNALINASLQSQSGWRPSDTDMDLLNKIFKDNEVAKQAILANATSQDAFNTWVAIKQDDLARQQRAEMTSFGLHSVLGGLAGMIADPLNLIPFYGDGALVAKATTGLGIKALAEIGENRLFKIAGSALEMGTVNMLDSYQAQINGTRQANPAESFALGALGAAGLSALRHFVFTGGQKTKAIEDLANKYGQTLDKSAMEAMNVGDPGVVRLDAKLRGESTFRPQQTINPEAVTAVPASETESVLRKMMGVSEEPSLKMQRAQALSDKWFGTLDPNSPASTLLGQSASGILRKLGLAVDVSIRDVLQNIADNPQNTSLIQKTASKYLKQSITEDSLNRLVNKYSTRQTEDYTGKVLQALSDGPGSQSWKQVKRLTGINADDDLRDSLKQVLYRKTGVIYAEDGSKVIVNGLPNTEGAPMYDAMVRPEIFTDAEHLNPLGTTDEAPKVTSGIASTAQVRQESQVFKSKIMQYIGQKAQSTKYYGNTYGHMTNSPSNTLRDFGRRFLTDTRLNPERLPEGGLDFSQRKSILFRSMQNHLAEGMRDGFSPWFTQNMKLGLSAAKDEFGRQVEQAYDEIYKHNIKPTTQNPYILKMVEHLHDLRQEIQSEMKRAGLLQNTVEDTGLWRKVDADKLSDLIRSHGGQEGLIKDLAAYGRTFANREKYEEMFNKIAPEERVDTLDDFIKRETQNWAYGIVDRGLSDTKLSHTDLNKADKMEEWLRRAPIDTRGVMKMSDGMNFSFDHNLRDLDVYKTARNVIDRTSASVALRDVGINDMHTYFNDLRATVQRELQEAVDVRRMKPSAMRDAMEELDWTISHSIGRPFGNFNTRDQMSKFSRLMTKQSYAMNGYNMGLNQISENFNALGITGTRAITNMIPGLRRVLRSFTQRPLTTDQANRLRTAYSYGNYTMFNPMNLSVPQAERIGVLGKVYGKTSDALDLAGDLTTAVNRISAMTNNVISILEVDVFEDLLHWAQTGKGSSYIKEARNFESAGVKDIPSFKQTLADTFTGLNKADPDAATKALDKLRDKNYDVYTQLRAFTQQASSKAILQPTISNGNYFLKKGTLAPIIMQFQNFSRMALDSHLMRGLEHWDKEMTLGLIGSGVSAGTLWYARTWLYGQFKYKDTNQRQAFYDQVLTPENLVRAGFIRSATLAGVSPLNDWYEAATGAGTIRTTVQRKSNQGFNVGSAIAQYPAIKALQDDYTILSSGASAIHDSLMRSQVYQDDISGLTKLLPADKWVGTQLLMTQLGMNQGDTFVNTYPKRPSGVPRINSVVNAVAPDVPPKSALSNLLKGNGNSGTVVPKKTPEPSILDKLLGGNE